MDGFVLPLHPEWPLILRYGALVLRPLRWRDEHAYHVLRARNRDWTGPWDATIPDGTPGQVLGFSRMVRTQRAAAREGTQLPWMLAWDDSAHSSRHSAGSAPMIGQLTVAGITYGSARFASIGYWIDEGHAGRGLMPIAVAMACDHSFDVLGLHRVEICIRPENGPSRRVAQKLGFRLEGMRRRYLHIAGDWRDHEAYVMTAEERPAGGLVQALTGGIAPQPVGVARS